jgi:predicted nucleic acid-binding Zn ribbon protein
MGFTTGVAGFYPFTCGCNRLQSVVPGKSLSFVLKFLPDASANPNRNCPACGKPLNGRVDKRFCDDYCRNGYNNQLKSASNNLVRNINNALGKNRRILKSLLQKVKKQQKSIKKNYSDWVPVQIHY